MRILTPKTMKAWIILSMLFISLFIIIYFTRTTIDGNIVLRAFQNAKCYRISDNCTCKFCGKTECEGKHMLECTWTRYSTRRANLSSETSMKPTNLDSETSMKHTKPDSETSMKHTKPTSETGMEYTKPVNETSMKHTKTLHNTNLANHKKPTTFTTASMKPRGKACSKECITNNERVKFLKQSCADMKKSVFTTNLNRNFEEIVILKPKKHTTNIGYCTTYKSASNFMYKYLTVLSGKLPTRIQDPFTIDKNKLANKPLVQISNLTRLKNTYNFMIARDPYTRLLSFYVDKLYTTNFYYWGSVGRVALRITRKGGVRKSCGHDVTFAEFIEHVITAEKSGRNRNEHGYPAYQACYPCSGINYTYIIKLETMINDLREILDQTNLTSPVDLSKVGEFNAHNIIGGTLYRAFNVEIFVCISFEESLKRAWKVLQIRGVLSHDATFPHDAINNYTTKHTRLSHDAIKNNATKNRHISKETFRELIKASRLLHPMTKEQKRAMKLDTLSKAYKTVPMKLLEGISDVYGPDFSLFGYDTNPEYLRKRDEKLETAWQPFIVT